MTAARLDETEVRRELISVPKQRAAQLTGITVRRLDYWDEQGVTRPTTVRHIGARRIKFYDYDQLLSLQVASTLRDRDTSLRQILTIVERVRAEGIDEPLTQVRYAFDQAGHVYFDLRGTDDWEGVQRPKHFVIAEALDLRPMDARILTGLQRDEQHFGEVERRRGTMGSKPVFAGTRVPVETVRRYLHAGRSVDDILAAFPILSEADVRVAAAG